MGFDKICSRIIFYNIVQGATVDSYVDDCLIYTPLVQGAGITLNCQT